MRIVLDTNQLIRALMRPPGLATFVMAWEARRFTVIASPALLAEYELVLNFPAIAELIYPELLRAFRSHLQLDIEVVTTPDIAPLCRDPDDDKVIATAIFGAADFLVTADDDLRTPAVREALSAANTRIVTIDELIRMLD